VINENPRGNTYLTSDFSRTGSRRMAQNGKGKTI